MANSIQYRMPKGRRDNSRAGLRGAIAVLLAAMALAVFSDPALAGGAAAIQFNIPAQPLSSGLIEFSRQANVQVLTAGSRLRGVNTPGLYGSFSVISGIEHLLTGTGFGYHLIGNDTISLIPPPGRKIRLDGSHEADSETMAQAGEDVNAGWQSDGGSTGDNRSSKAPALQEVLVTAQKYRQREFDVPISLQVITGQEMQRHGITNLNNLQFDVPGLYMNSTGDTHSVYLRGVGNVIGNGALVGQYIDNADITAETVFGGDGYATGNGGLYDLKRVEVLKGPQGTLYGDGSMGGVIRYITNKPVLDRFGMSADVTALFTQYGAPGQHIQTMLNTPLVTGTLGLRIAGLFEHDGGWVDEPAASLKNINNNNLTDVRIEALWHPTAGFKINAMQIIHREAGGLVQSEDASGNYTPAFGPYTPTMEDSSNLSNLTVSYDFDVARLLSSSTYFNEQEDEHNISDIIPSPPVTYWFFSPYFHANDQDFSEELRLVHAGGGPWQWTVGTFYKRFREHPTYGAVEGYLGLAGSSLASALPIPGFDERDSSNSWAGFADTSYTFFRRLTAGAGVRYFTDRETFTVYGYSNSGSTPLEAARFTSTDPRFYVQYKVSPHINTYASASKGFRSGGFNSPPSSPYQPEVLWSYDLGTKVRYPREGVRADIDLFYMNYSNYASEDYVPPLYPITNVGRARIQGVDADLMWLPVRRWRIGFNTELLKTEFLTATQISGYAPGDRLPFAPTYSFTASVQRNLRIRGKRGDAEIYYYEISRVQYRAPLSQSAVQHFLNFRAAIHCNRNLQLAIFAHNLLNDRGFESPFGIGESIRPRPRTFGVSFDVTFGGGK